MEGFFHHPHGEALHDLCIYLTKRLCYERDYIFLDPKWLAGKALYPGEPDVYVRVPYRRTESKGRATHGYIDYIIEIETRASRNSIEKKINQFYGPNLEILIIDLAKFEGDKSNWHDLQKYISERLPT
jgi:hypothetical protein